MTKLISMSLKQSHELSICVFKKRENQRVRRDHKGPGTTAPQGMAKKKY